MARTDTWYKDAIIYAVDVEFFMDTDDDGIGDFGGLTLRLDYLETLGVTCLWLLPFYPSPDRDNGYDIADYYTVDRRHGTPGDFVEFLREATGRGIRVLLDVVMNHTSDEHPWFQAARRDRNSPFRKFYVWTDDPSEWQAQKPIFPGPEQSVWTWDEQAGQYYFHQFYDFEPGLDLTSDDVRREIRRVMGYWLQLGVSGFRLDAISHMVAPKGPAKLDDPEELLETLRQFAVTRRGDATLIGEADVEPEELDRFLGSGNRLQMLFNFLLDNYLFLGFAREEAVPIRHGLELMPSLPASCAWGNFLRNLDELDLERLSLAEREQVFRAFAPKEEMRIYGRGIRRRLAPMFRGNRQRLEMAYSLLFGLPGTPVIVYGDEIGMGDDLSLPGRRAVRTPMQWTDEPNAGFSRAPAERLTAPVISRGTFGYKRVNVAAQKRDPGSFLHWMQGLIRIRKECPEIGWGSWSFVETGNEAVLALRYEWHGNVVIVLSNLSRKSVTVDLDLPKEEARHLVELHHDRDYGSTPRSVRGLTLSPYGYRWFRVHPLRRGPGEV